MGMRDGKYLTAWGTELHTYLDNAILKQDGTFESAATQLVSSEAPVQRSQSDELIRQLYQDQRQKAVSTRHDSASSKPTQAIMDSFADFVRACVLGDAEAEKMMEENDEEDEKAIAMGADPDIIKLASKKSLGFD